MLRSLKHRFRWLRRLLGIGIDAPKVPVGRVVPDYLKVGAGIFLGCVLTALGFGVTRWLAPAAEERGFKPGVFSVRDGGQKKVEESVKQGLLQQIADLEAKNSRLQERLTFYERMKGGALPESPGAVPNGDLPKIARVSVKPGAGGKGVYAYEFVIQRGPGGAKGEFRGRLRLAIKLNQGGKDAMIFYPSPGNQATSKEFLIVVKRFVRVRGAFRVPETAAISSVDVQILDGDTVMIHQEVGL